LERYEVKFRPVGVVKTDCSDNQIKERDRESESVIEIFQEFQEALQGLDGFSNIFVLAFLHRLRPDQIGPLKVRPRRLLRKGFRLDEIPEVGVFAIASPTRPNPIALSLVKLLRIDGGRIFVSGLDLFNGTPILDIKPYRGDYRVEQYALAGWYQKLRDKAGSDI